MICPKCGSDIPSNFHFCGTCGAPLPLAEVPANAGVEQEAVSGLGGSYGTPVVEPEPTVGPEHAYSDETQPPESPGGLPPQDRGIRESGISGPSFLGLSEGTAESGGPYGYLLEDEPRSSHFGAIVLVILLAILGALAWRNWSAIEHYVAYLRRPPATVYPNAADHTDPGLTSDAKPPEHAPVPPDQQVAAAPSANSDQPQMTVEEQKKQSASDGNKPAGVPPERAAERSSGAEPPPSASADNSAQQETPSDTSSSVEEKQPAPPPKPARARAVTEKQPKEERGARMLLLGESYLYGRGVPRNCDQAVIYLKAAANAGNPAARSHLGALYSTGECVARDRVAAYHWFALASRAEPANPWLESNLNMLWRDMSPDERRRVGAER